MLKRTNQHDVLVAEVFVPDPQESTLKIDFRDQAVDLPVLLHTDDNGTTAFISTRDVREHLGVGIRVSQVSEWFALEYIPKSIITTEWHY